MSRKHTTESREKMAQSHTGLKHSAETKAKMSASHRLDRNHKYKGENASYRAKHIWLETNFGKPNTCENCEESGLSGHKIHWANLSGQYLRLRSDWKRLCARCHKRFDMGLIKL